MAARKSIRHAWCGQPQRRRGPTVAAASTLHTVVVVMVMVVVVLLVAVRAHVAVVWGLRARGEAHQI
eukprot:1151115-Pelagomonas_calceolata.AAC.5